MARTALILALTLVLLVLGVDRLAAADSPKSGKSHKSGKRHRSCKSGKSHKHGKSRKSGKSGKSCKSDKPGKPEDSPVPPPNQPPVANQDANLIATAHILVNHNAPGVLTGSYDPDGDPLTALAGTSSSTLGARVTIFAHGAYRYNQLPSAVIQALAIGESIVDTFEFTVSDGRGGTDVGVVTVLVTAVR
jgi:VCBS repeat-containing protein